MQHRVVYADDFSGFLLGLTTSGAAEGGSWVLYTVSGKARKYIRGLLFRSLRRCLKLQREYAIELTPNPARDSLGRWQVSMFVDA